MSILPESNIQNDEAAANATKDENMTSENATQENISSENATNKNNVKELSQEDIIKGIISNITNTSNAHSVAASNWILHNDPLNYCIE